MLLPENNFKDKKNPIVFDRLRRKIIENPFTQLLIGRARLKNHQNTIPFIFTNWKTWKNWTLKFNKNWIISHNGESKKKFSIQRKESQSKCRFSWTISHVWICFVDHLSCSNKKTNILTWHWQSFWKSVDFDGYKKLRDINLNKLIDFYLY